MPSNVAQQKRGRTKSQTAPVPRWTAFDRWCDGVQLLDLSRPAHTVRAWQTKIVAWHRDRRLL
jgi:hypothetical protein